MNAQWESVLKYTAQYVVPLVSLVVSFFAIFVALGQNDKIDTANQVAKESNVIAKEAKELVEEANKISEEANVVGVEANEIAKEGNAILQKQVSTDNVEDVYDEIYGSDAYKQIIYDHLKPKVAMENTQTLKDFMNVFEGVGSGYCQGLIRAPEIRSYLGKTLRHVCTNADVATYFPQGKNGVAILCERFVPNSRYAQKVVPGSMEGCAFVEE